MKALITGGSGFLGSHLTKQLLNINKYENIKILSRDPSKLSHLNSNDRIELMKGDIQDKSLLKKAFANVDEIFHLAALVDSWPKDPKKGYYQTNVEGTTNVLTSAQYNDVKKVIYCSSYFAIGETFENIADESWKYTPSINHPYVTTKFEAGNIVSDFINKSKFELIIVNPTVVIGSRMDNPVSQTIRDFINKKLIGLPNGGSSLMNFVSVEDVVNGMVLAGEKGRHGEKYILGSENMSFSEFLMKFGLLLGYNKPRKIPSFIAKLYALSLELNPLKKPKFTREDLDISTRNWQYTSNKAKRELGYEPTPVDPKKYLKFLETEGKLNKKVEEKISELFF